MLAGKLGDVALQVLRTHLVERAVVRPLEHGPEALDAVGMRHAVNVFANRMLDRFVVVGDAPISRRFIGVDRGIGGCVIGDEALQRLRVRLLHHLGAHGVGGAILRAHNRRLASRATTLKRFALALWHVAALAAHVGFVNLDRTIERTVAAFAPCFPNAVQHEPRRRLRNANIPMQLHGRNRLQAGKAQVDRDGPLAQRDIGTSNRRSGANAEIGPAIRAPVGHRLGVGNVPRVNASAFPAVAPVAPNDGFEPRRRLRFIGKHVRHLNQRQTFAVGFPGVPCGPFQLSFR